MGVYKEYDDDLIILWELQKYMELKQVDIKFVNSIYEHLQTKGFITDKQMDILKKIYEKELVQSFLESQGYKTHMDT